MLQLAQYSHKEMEHPELPFDFVSDLMVSIIKMLISWFGHGTTTEVLKTGCCHLRNPAINTVTYHSMTLQPVMGHVHNGVPQDHIA